MRKNWLNRWLILIFLFLGAGCVSAPPIKTDLAQLMAKPLFYADQRVEFSGYVARNVSQGEEYVIWSLTLTNNGEDIFCQEKGWNIGVIREAWDMAEEAKEKGEPIVVTGIVLINHQEMARGIKIGLETVEYQGQKILTDYDDYPPWRYRYYDRPFFWPFPPYYYYPFGYPYYW